MIKREVRERIRARGFRIATVILVAGAVAAGVVPSLLGDEEHTIDVGVIGTPSAALEAALRFTAAASGDKLQVTPLPSVAVGDSELKAGNLDVVVEGAARIHVHGDRTGERSSDFAQRLAQVIPMRTGLESAGVPPDRIERALAPTPLPIRSVEPPREDAGSRDAVFIGGLILYIALVTYGGWVASGVLEEKSSRVIEVVLAAVRPSELLAGKVIGVGLVGLGQLVAVGGVGLAAAALAGSDPPSSVSAAVGLVALWFVLGFAFYSCAFAALGAAASRQEDAQAAMGPLVGLLVAAYLLSTAVQTNPDGLLARVGSFVPPLAPMTVPARVLLGHAPLWEVLLSVALMLAGTYALVRLGARAYGGAVLRFGARLGLRELLTSSTGRRSRGSTVTP